jgi:hypothetical protein
MSSDSGEVEYAAVSRLSVAALGMGLAAATALVGPAFLGVPLLGIALAVAALADIRRAGGLKIGRLAAVAGLALSVGFGAQAATGLGVSRWLAARRAEEAARLFLEAVRDDRIDDARGMGGLDAEAVVTRLADCCRAAGGSPDPAADPAAVPIVARRLGAGDVAGTWRVQVAIGRCGGEIVLGPESGMLGGVAGERWYVLGGDVVTPR